MQRVQLPRRRTKALAVIDTGIGIPAEKQAMIFEPFSQVDASTTRRYGGTGLGLTITSQLVALMGGRIWVASHVGQGSTFHFTLPLEARPESPGKRQEREMATDLRGMAVLVVDDNLTNRRILEEVLINWEMRPTLVNGGGEALLAMERARIIGEPFALVLLDCQMPDMDGHEVAERIKHHPPPATPTEPFSQGFRMRLLTEGGLQEQPTHGYGMRECIILGIKPRLVPSLKIWPG